MSRPVRARRWQPGTGRWHFGNPAVVGVIMVAERGPFAMDNAGRSTEHATADAAVNAIRQAKRNSTTSSSPPALKPEANSPASSASPGASRNLKE
jgi:hypothetical protein